MKRKYSSISFLSAYLLLKIIFIGSIHAQQVLITDTFYYSGTTQTFVIPTCASAMTMQVTGAQGAIAGSGFSPGGGGYVQGILTPTPGTVLYLTVGGMGTGSLGGFNGGGNGGQGSSQDGAGGGGATDIRLAGNALTNRIIVAGGGGGGGSGYLGGPAGAPSGGGDGGDYFGIPCGSIGVGGMGGGGNYYINPTNWGGCAAGTSTMVGAGGAGAGVMAAGGLSGGGSGSYGQAGGLGIGGNGGGSTGLYGGGGGGVNGAGGGGAGYYGGAGGMADSYTISAASRAAGGGGGSSYADPALFSSISFSGTGNSNGMIVINYFSTNVFTSSLSLCSGASSTLTASGMSTYTWHPAGTFGGSNTPSIVVSPNISTMYTVSGTSSLGCVSHSIIAVTVGTVPSSTTSLSVCEGSNITLSASGATSYTWLPSSTFIGSSASSVVVFPASSTNYTVNASNLSGCISQSVFAVTVNSSPTITIHISPSATVCSGEMVILTAATSANNYIWMNSLNSTTASVPSLVVYPNVNTTYSVSSSNVNGCLSKNSTQITVNACTSLLKMNTEHSKIKIYPNPNIGSFNLWCDRDIMLNVINQLGQCVKKIELNEQNERRVTINNFSEGIYFIVGSDSQSIIAQKIIVMNH